MKRQIASVQAPRHWWPIHRHAKRWTARAFGEGRTTMEIVAPAAGRLPRPPLNATASDIAAPSPAPVAGSPAAAQPRAGEARDGTILVISDDRPAVVAIRR